jgi:hypothetical protein
VEVLQVSPVLQAELDEQPHTLPLVPVMHRRPVPQLVLVPQTHRPELQVLPGEQSGSVEHGAAQSWVVSSHR